MKTLRDTAISFLLAFLVFVFMWTCHNSYVATHSGTDLGDLHPNWVSLQVKQALQPEISKPLGYLTTDAFFLIAQKRQSNDTSVHLSNIMPGAYYLVLSRKPGPVVDLGGDSWLITIPAQ
jgi:hypothetical protein